MADTSTKVQEPTIVFLYDFKNWYESISPLSKMDLFDIAPIITSQFYLDHTINAYVFVLVKSKWDSLSQDIKRKFMFISRRVKEEMEGVMTTSERDAYENADIFELLMQNPKP